MQLEALASLASSVPEGDFAEVGVYQGGSAAVLYGVAVRQNRSLHLFDTFTGTPFFTPGLDKHEVNDEFAAEEVPAKLLDAFPSPALHIYVGIYPETHPASLAKLALVHCDCDQYESYKAVIKHMWPLLVEGGVMIFDDYPYLRGAKRAVEEHFAVGSLRPIGQRAYVIKGAAVELQ